MTAAATQTREEWLAERNDFADGHGAYYLGASDLSKIVAQNPHGSALEVYFEKRGLIEPREADARMRRGTRMEPYVAQTFADLYGWPVRKAQMVRHPEKPYLAVNPDFEADSPDDGLVALETKSHKWFVRSDYGEEWSDVVPAYIQVQAQWQCRLGGYKTCIVAAMFGMDEDDLQCFRVEHDPEYSALIEEVGTRFVEDHLLPGIPPPVSDLASDQALLKRLYSRVSPSRAECTAEIDEIARQLRDATVAAKRLDKDKTALQNRILEHMGEAGELHTAAGKFTRVAGGGRWVERYFCPEFVKLNAPYDWRKL